MTGFGRGDVTGLWATLGNAGSWSGLTVALYLTPLLKRLNTAILAGVEGLRTQGAWGTLLRHTGHSSGAPP